MTPITNPWSKAELITRLRELETKKHTKSTHSPTSKKTIQFLITPKSHPKRKIAIKFCYSGWEYNGLAYQNGPTPSSTVEDVLFEAFVKARLVDETGRLDTASTPSRATRWYQSRCSFPAFHKATHSYPGRMDTWYDLQHEMEDLANDEHELEDANLSDQNRKFQWLVQIVAQAAYNISGREERGAWQGMFLSLIRKMLL